MPMLASKLLHPIIAGLFISGLVATMMSTADSLLVSTSAITEDLGIGFKIRAKSLDAVTNSRIFTVFMGIMTYGIALFSEYTDKTIFSVVSYAWSGLGSAFGPALLMTLWWKKTTRMGIIAGLLTGFLTIIWVNIPYLNDRITERLSSFILAITAIYLTSKNKMQIREVLNDAKSGLIHPVYYLKGSDYFLQSFVIEKISNFFNNEPIAKHFLHPDDLSQKEILDKLTTSDLFMTKQMFIILKPHRITDDARKDLIELCFNPIENHLMFLINDDFQEGILFFEN